MLSKCKLISVDVRAYVGCALSDYFFVPPDDVIGKNVLVTGASRGIGKELAIQYAKLGANVFITARNEDALNEVIYNVKFL